jgi:hypothetical protein
MNQPPPRTAYFLFDTKEDPLNYSTPSKPRRVAISVRYKSGLFARPVIRNLFAADSASSRPSLVSYQCISSRQTPELKPNVTCRKQKTALRPNRQIMHGWKNPFSASDSLTQSMGHGSRITNHDSQLTNHKSQITNHTNGSS